MTIRNLIYLIMNAYPWLFSMSIYVYTIGIYRYRHFCRLIVNDVLDHIKVMHL